MRSLRKPPCRMETRGFLHTGRGMPAQLLHIWFTNVAILTTLRHRGIQAFPWTSR